MKFLFYNILNNRFLFVFLVLLSSQVKAQNDNGLEQLISNSRDSLNTNPNYTYDYLSSVIKSSTISSSLKSNAYVYLSEYFNRNGVTDSAIFYANKGLSKLSSEKEKAIAYRVIGSSCIQSGKKDEALDWLLKSLQIGERLKIEKVIISVKSDLGHLYFQKLKK